MNHAIAACAVFFAPRSPLNETHLLAANGPPPTSQRAELMGGIKALEAAKRLAARPEEWGYEDLNQVVIKADSAYLVRGATEWVSKWEARGWMNAKGTPVINQELFQRLEGCIRELESLGVLVQFFHVPRQQNQCADAAANEALDQVGEPRSIATPFRVDPLPAEQGQVVEPRRANGGRRTILMVSLDGQPWFDDMYSSLLSSLHDRARVRRVADASSLLDQLGSDSPAAVLVTDPGITHRKHRQALQKLVEYVSDGGTAVFCGTFSSFIQPSDLTALFRSQFGLPWQAGNYCRTTFQLNELAAANLPSSAHLSQMYQTKATHLHGVEHPSALYLPDDDEPHTQTSAAWARVKQGWAGYIGDVNAEKETDWIILSMILREENSTLTHLPDTVLNATLDRSRRIAASGLAPPAEPFRVHKTSRTVSLARGNMFELTETLARFWTRAASADRDVTACRALPLHAVMNRLNGNLSLALWSASDSFNETAAAYGHVAALPDDVFRPPALAMPRI
ncbi:hypothetical protein SLS56_012087 [Neofusicoccum ribis]|uniref:ribonuclease H n=1 Tax=Neofusicoccum ribis TaxID=45134 RepID=A0ABR3S9U2_9PEZI